MLIGGLLFTTFPGGYLLKVPTEVQQRPNAVMKVSGEI